MAFVSNRVCTSHRSIPFIFTIKLKQLLGGSHSTSAFVILLQGKTMSLSELKHLFLIKRVSYLINFPFSNTRGMESYWFLHFLHVSTTRKIIEKLARINEVSSRAVQPIPWKCEVFLWEQAFNFVPAEDRETEQNGLRLEVDAPPPHPPPGWRRRRVQSQVEPTLYMHACVEQKNVSASPLHTVWSEKSREVQIKTDPQQPPTHPRSVVKEELRDSNQWLNETF